MQFTTQELAALMRLMDAAVRANGLGAAYEAAPIAAKINTELQSRNRAIQQQPAESADQGN
jgi:hypothetical protein